MNIFIKKAYFFAVIVPLSLCAAQDDGDRKSSVAQEASQSLTVSNQDELDERLLELVSSRDRNLNEIEALLQKNADPNYTGALEICRETNQMSLLELVMTDRNEAPNSTLALVELLLKYKARPHRRCDDDSLIFNCVRDAIRYVNLERERISWSHLNLPEGRTFAEKRKKSFDLIALFVRYDEINNPKRDDTTKELINQQEMYEGNTALILAARNNDPELVSFLLDLGADDTIKNRKGETFHDYAVKCYPILRAHQAWTLRVQQKLNEFLPSSISTCIGNNLGITQPDFAFMKAVEHGTTNDMEAALKDGADVRTCIVVSERNIKLTPYPSLYYALLKSDSDKIKTLIKYGVNIHEKVGHKLSETGQPWGNCLSALMHDDNRDKWDEKATINCLRLLVDAGLDVNELNAVERHPLLDLIKLSAFAITQKKDQMADNICTFLEFVLEQGADTTAITFEPSHPKIADIIQQAKFKRRSSIDQLLHNMPTDVVGLIWQYSDNCLESAKPQADAGDEKE